MQIAESVLAELRRVLMGERDEFAALALLSPEKEKSVTAGLVEELSAVVRQETAHLARIDELEASRRMLIDAICRHAGCDSLTLAELIAQLDASKLREELAALGRELSRLISAQAKKNAHIAQLLKVQLDYTGTMLELYAGGEPINNMYDYSGSEEGTSGSGAAFYDTYI